MNVLLTISYFPKILFLTQDRIKFFKMIDILLRIFYYHYIIFGAGCNSLPAVKPASLFGRHGVIPWPTVKFG